MIEPHYESKSDTFTWFGSYGTLFLMCPTGRTSYRVPPKNNVIYSVLKIDTINGKTECIGEGTEATAAVIVIKGILKKEHENVRSQLGEEE